jgi:hypothetical protein
MSQRCVLGWELDASGRQQPTSLAVSRDNSVAADGLHCAVKEAPAGRIRSTTLFCRQRTWNRVITFLATLTACTYFLTCSGRVLSGGKRRALVGGARNCPVASATQAGFRILLPCKSS